MGGTLGSPQAPCGGAGGFNVRKTRGRKGRARRAAGDHGGGCGVPGSGMAGCGAVPGLAPGAATPQLPVLFERATDAELAALVGKVRQLSLDQAGCRTIQEAFTVASNKWRIKLASELHSHVPELLESMHGNHVLQKVVEVLIPKDAYFVQQEMSGLGHVSERAKHPFACRVLERLIEHFPSEWLESMLKEVLDEAEPLLRHKYGSYVLQHIMEHGTGAQRRRIVAALRPNLRLAANDLFVVGVLDKALTYSTPSEQVELACQVLEEPGLLASLLVSGWAAFDATRRLFSVLQGRPLERAAEILRACKATQQQTKEGRALAATLEPLLVRREICH